MPSGQSTEAPCDMTTKLVHSEDPNALSAVRRVLAEQACFAMPTDTVYGLCADPRGDASVQSLFAAKGRPETKAIPVLLGSLDQLPEIAAVPLPPLAEHLAKHFWPGPLTLILEAGAGLPDALLAGGTTVAVRVVANPIFHRIALATGPLATTSANRSGGQDCQTAAQVMAQLGGRIPLVLDGGASPDTRPSTIVKPEGEGIRILRTGSLEPAVRRFAEQCGTSVL